VKISERLKDGDVLSIAGGIKVMLTPGHSLGHIVLLLQQDNVLVCGDICANMMGLDYSTVYEDRALGVQSVLKAATLGFDKAVFGHGNALVGGASEKMRKHFERLN
jgi:glyoxylase-like metal-dependent hydrolase (beta-lactamase superfamily II)